MTSKTRNTIISIIFSIILVPIIVNLLLLDRLSITFGDDWHGFFGDYFGAIIGGLVAYMLLQLQRDQEQESKHESNRSFVYIEEYSGHYRLKNSGLPSKTKIIQTEDYLKFISNMNKENPSELENGRMGFFKISHKGYSETIFNCKVLLKGSGEDDDGILHPVQKSFRLSMVSKDDEIYIPLIFNDFKVILPTVVEVTYRTMSNEYMIYLYDIENCLESYYKWEVKEKNKLMVSPLNAISWEYPLQQYGNDH